jgi:hypothetical protein
MTESDLKTLENKIRDLPIEKATNVKPEDLGLTSTELDQYIKDSNSLFLGKTDKGVYFKKFWLNNITKVSKFIVNPLATEKDHGANSVVYAVRVNSDNSHSYSEGSYNMDNSKWKPITENIQKIIDLNSQ